jgi:hypothetical protein
MSLIFLKINKPTKKWLDKDAFAKPTLFERLEILACGRFSASFLTNGILSLALIKKN